MSKTISVSTIIDKPLNDVWSEVSILKNHTNWMKDAVNIEFLDEKTQGLGTKMKVFTWKETLKFPIYLAGPIGEFFGGPVLKLIWKNNLNGLKDLFENEK